MLQKTQGIVLHSLKYKDTSIIVDIYTEVSGRASFLVPVSRSRKAAVKSVLFNLCLWWSWKRISVRILLYIR